MKKIITTIICVLIVAIVIIIGVNNKGSHDDVNPDEIIPSSEETGNIGEKLIGDASKAKVIIYEYADFGCSHCAEQNRVINNLIKKHADEIAVVFRSYNLGLQNSSFSARAATAAQLQGYFGEYKDLLFENQAEWSYEKGDKLNTLFIEYFKQASKDKGDIDKFKEDMKSAPVKKRLDFEQKLGKKINLRGTPLFRINGENIPINELTERIEKTLR